MLLALNRKSKTSYLAINLNLFLFCMRYCLLLVIVFFMGNVAGAQQVKKGAAPSWTEKISFDVASTPPPGQEAGHFYLLIDEQENIATQEAYAHYVYRILTNEGLQQMSDFNISFDPSYETLTFHSFVIHRNGEAINKLPVDIRTVQREQNMDRFLYDESLSALINLQDVRIGDVVEYAFTRKGYNPVYNGHIDRRVNVNYAFPYAKGYNRYLVPDSKKLQFNYYNTDEKPTISTHGALTTYTWNFEDVPALAADNNEPYWYNGYAYVQLSSMKSWREVAQWALPYYQLPAADSEWMSRVLAAAPQEPEAYAQYVIKMVQDDIRYLGFESGLNSHKPHPPRQVYEQRFGDCKDKSLLLVAMLRAKGIEAHPMLVSTYLEQRITTVLPAINAFNHCVVKMRWQNGDVFVDPTINNQGGRITDIRFPYYAQGLVISDDTEQLLELPRPSNSGTREVHHIQIDEIGGAAAMKVTTTFIGTDAESQRTYFASNSLAEIQKGYLNYYGNLYPDIKEFEQVKYEDDRESNTFVVYESYTVPNMWKPVPDTDGKLQCEFYPVTLETYFNVSKSEQRSSPYRLPYPVNHLCEINVNLPEAWNLEESNEHITTDYYNYDYAVKGNGSSFTIRTHYVTKESYVPLDDFKKFVKDHEVMMNNLGYYLTYDKNATAAGGSIAGTLFIVVITLVAAALVFWLYRYYDPAAQYPAKQGISIDGWLFLVAIGISLTPIRVLYDFITDPSLLNAETWMSLWTMDQRGLAAFVMITQVYNIFYLLFSGLLVVLFYMRRSSLPLLACIMYGASAVMTVVDAFVANQISSEVYVSTQDVVRALGTAAIWIPYFLVSERVKKTFVKRYREEEASEADQTIYTLRD